MIRLGYSDYRPPGGYRRRVHCWNAVDVLREDGMLHHGTVVGAEPEGLVVDFGCTGQRRQLVAYGTAFNPGCSDEEPLRNAQPGSGVEVLLRQEPAGPWVWRLGTLVTQDIPEPGYGYLALVDVQLAGVGRREVVDVHQVRPPPSSAKLRSRILRQDHFQVSRLSPLPAAITALLPSHLPHWKALCQNLYNYLSPISVSSTELVYLRPSSSHYLAQSESDMNTIFDNAPGWIADGIERGAVWVKQGWQCSGSLAAASLMVEDSAEWTLQNVTHLVVEKMLSCLGTMQRASVRRVCRLFDELVCGILSADIWLAYRECGLDNDGGYWGCCGCSELLQHYPVVTPLFKCLMARTRYIILTGEAKEQRDLDDECVLSKVPQLVGICRQLGHFTTGQTMVLVGGHCEVEGDEVFFWENVSALAASLAGGWWKKLLLKRCTMTTSLPGLEFSGVVGVASLVDDLGALVERQLPAVNVQWTVEWLEQVLQDELPGRDELEHVLSVFATGDPRAGNFYANYHWNDEQLASLDFTRLSRLAQYAVSCIAPPYYLFQGLPKGF